MKKSNEKHRPQLPSARQVRRSCNRELYRTLKKLKLRIPPEDVAKAEQFYFAKLVPNLVWVAENGSNRKRLADWWEEHVAPGIAEIWKVDAGKLSRAFRDAFGG